MSYVRYLQGGFVISPYIPVSLIHCCKGLSGRKDCHNSFREVPDRGKFKEACMSDIFKTGKSGVLWLVGAHLRPA